MKLIIDIPEQDFHRVCQGYIDYSNTLEGRCLTAISESVLIPDNATNGDVIHTLFPNAQIGGVVGNLEKSWWNASYQRNGRRANEVS